MDASGVGNTAAAPILLVDDHPPNLLVLEALLEPLGQELVRATSGEEALKCISEREFAVVLLDVQMPGMDGFETATRIRRRENGRYVPIIFVTAEEAYGEDYAHRAYSQGAIDFLIKPFKAAIVISKVRVLVDLYRRRETIRLQEETIRRAEREAMEQQSEARLLALIDLMPFCMVAVHSDGIPYFCNRAWREYTGIALDRASPQALFEALHPDDRPRTREVLQGALEGGRPVELECRLRQGSDGSFRWHVVRGLPEFGQNGNVVGWLATAMDVERQKTAEQEATDANRMKDEFLAIVSHDLRTPLSSILGWASILASGKADESKLRRGLETIQRNARAQAHLIDDLLDVARIISGKMRVQRASIDVRASVQAAVEALQPIADAREINLSAALMPVPATLGDPERLQQVVSNLLTNAVKFTPPGGKVAVGLRVADDSIEVDVCDTGCGIDPSFLPHVFDRFRQNDPAAGRRHGGLGLGLAIAEHLVRLHGGTIAAHSSGIGQGARFTVRLPVLPAPDTQSASANSTHSHANAVSPRSARRLTDLKILVVDDDHDSRDLLQQVLTAAGAEVLVAPSAGEAKQLFDRCRPDVLLSDIELADGDGYSLLRAIRARPADEGGDVPAAALTAFTRPQDEAAARKAGFDIHIAKPVEPFEVVDVVFDLARIRR